MAISTATRKLVIERANDCCEYCRLAQRDDTLTFHVDHIVALKHHGDDDPANLCFACYRCNAFKGSNVAALDPQTGDAARLFNPRKDIWNDHFELLDNNIIEGKTPEGRVTVSVLRMNDTSRVQQRLTLFNINRYPCDGID